MAVCLPGWALCALRSWAPKDVVWLSLPGCHVPPGMLSGQGLLSQSGTYRRHRSDRQRRFRLAAPRELAESLPGGTHQGGFIPRTWCRGGLPALAPNCKGRLVSPGQKDLALAPGAQSTKPVLGVLAVRGGGGVPPSTPSAPPPSLLLPPGQSAPGAARSSGAALWTSARTASPRGSSSLWLSRPPGLPGAWALGPGPWARGWVGSLPPLEGTPKKNLSKGAPSRSEALRALRPTCPKPLRSPHTPPPVSSGPILSGQGGPCSDGPALGYGGPRARVCIYGALALALRFQVVFLRSSNNKLVILSLLVSFWLPCFLPSCPRPRPCPCPCLSFPRSLLLYGPHLRRASVARPRGSASHRGCQAGPSDPDRPFPQGAWRDLREVFPALVLPACDGPSWLESSSSYQVFGQNQSGSQGKPKAEVQETSWEKAHREGRGGSPRCHLCPAFPARRAVTRPGPQSPGRDGASLFPAQPRKQPSPQEISE